MLNQCLAYFKCSVGIGCYDYFSFLGQNLVNFLQGQAEKELPRGQGPWQMRKRVGGMLHIKFLLPPSLIWSVPPLEGSNREKETRGVLLLSGSVMPQARVLRHLPWVCSVTTENEAGMFCALVELTWNTKVLVPQVILVQSIKLLWFLDDLRLMNALTRQETRAMEILVYRHLLIQGALRFFSLFIPQICLWGWGASGTVEGPETDADFISLKCNQT